jgi:hypothetical protein
MFLDRAILGQQIATIFCTRQLPRKLQSQMHPFELNLSLCESSRSPCTVNVKTELEKKADTPFRKKLSKNY